MTFSSQCSSKSRVPSLLMSSMLRPLSQDIKSELMTMLEPKQPHWRPKISTRSQEVKIRVKFPIKQPTLTRYSKYLQMLPISTLLIEQIQCSEFNNNLQVSNTLSVIYNVSSKVMLNLIALPKAKHFLAQVRSNSSSLNNWTHWWTSSTGWSRTWQLWAKCKTYKSHRLRPFKHRITSRDKINR
jgi:hypothetical protein